MIDHQFVSAVADGQDATLVRPSNWNALHFIRMVSSGSVTIPANHAAYVPDSYEIAVGDTLEISASGAMEIG